MTTAFFWKKWMGELFKKLQHESLEGRGLVVHIIRFGVGVWSFQLTSRVYFDDKTV